MAPPPTGPSCPICRRPAQQRWRPFCSRRCADVDLNRWLSGAYAIPVVEEEDEDGAPVPPPGGGDGGDGAPPPAGDPAPPERKVIDFPRSRRRR